jgi:hypothetical protein
MDHLNWKGAPKMAEPKSHAEWQKANTIVATVRLQKRTDADIIEYLKDKPTATTIKQALRLLMESENK